MFKSIVSKFQSFGKTVVTRIIGFVGGIFGIKPEVVQVPAPPEISNQEANNAPEATEKEGLIKKAFKAAKKVAVATIKAVIATLVIVTVIGSALITGLAIGYAINYALLYFGIFTLAATLLQTKGVAEGILIALAFIGLVDISVEAAMFANWVFLSRFHKLMWSLVISDKKVIPATEQIVEVEAAKTVSPEPTVTTVAINEVEAPKKEPAMKIQIIETPITSTEEVDAVVDIRPTTTPIEEVKPEIVPVVPVVIEIEEASEVVDTIRPNTEKLKIDNPKELKAQLIEINEKEIDSILMSYRTSDLKKMIESLNKFIQDGLNKGNNRKDKKTALITEIKKQLKFLNKNVAVA